jgi:hypothetical protein
MKINVKALDLVDLGLKPDTVAKLSESQINVLHSKLVSEITMVSKTDAGTINRLKTEKKPFEVYEKEMKEDEEDPMDFEKGERTQDPHQVGPSTDDGFKNYDDGTGEFNEEKSNPWAICTDEMGKEFGTNERSEWTKSQIKKYERCVKGVKNQKKSLKESPDSLNLYIENKIMKIVEKHIPPRMTKGQLLKYVTEQGPATAPSKPKESPTTKPGKPGTKPQKPGHPLKNPNPGEKPAPKAKYEKAKNEVIDLIINLLDK